MNNYRNEQGNYRKPADREYEQGYRNDDNRNSSEQYRHEQGRFTDSHNQGLNSNQGHQGDHDYRREESRNWSTGRGYDRAHSEDYRQMNTEYGDRNNEYGRGNYGQKENRYLANNEGNRNYREGSNSDGNYGSMQHDGSRYGNNHGMNRDDEQYGRHYSGQRENGNQQGRWGESYTGQQYEQFNENQRNGRRGQNHNHGGQYQSGEHTNEWRGNRNNEESRLPYGESYYEGGERGGNEFRQNEWNGRMSEQHSQYGNQGRQERYGHGAPYTGYGNQYERGYGRGPSNYSASQTEEGYGERDQDDRSGSVFGMGPRSGQSTSRW